MPSSRSPAAKSPLAAGTEPGVDHARNLRRLMARQGLTLRELARRSGLNLRTLKTMLRGNHRPHGRTLQRLAAGLGVPVDELFQDPSLLVHRLFDRRTNPVVDQVVDEERELFHGWTEAEFADLYSRFGHGGPLTRDGTIAVAHAINLRRRVQQQVALLLETGEAELFVDIIDLFYRRVLVVDADDDHGSHR
ncbi:MAG TPA: helix-turn-helix transcriptional regulator [Pirellulales bacterium]|jgi:transcriptional regulator with XRE-family HTH domain|nr:helix-turn-helix transcriptional regulator [Pirellulales bacterium]